MSTRQLEMAVDLIYTHLSISAAKTLGIEFVKYLERYHNDKNPIFDISLDPEQIIGVNDFQRRLADFALLEGIGMIYGLDEESSKSNLIRIGILKMSAGKFVIGFAVDALINRLDKPEFQKVLLNVGRKALGTLIAALLWAAYCETAYGEPDIPSSQSAKSVHEENLKQVAYEEDNSDPYLIQQENQEIAKKTDSTFANEDEEKGASIGCVIGVIFGFIGYAAGLGPIGVLILFAIPFLVVSTLAKHLGIELTVILLIILVIVIWNWVN